MAVESAPDFATKPALPPIAALRERGMTDAALGVDTANVSVALRLYESVGFRPVSKSTT